MIKGEASAPPPPQTPPAESDPTVADGRVTSGGRALDLLDERGGRRADRGRAESWRLLLVGVQVGARVEVGRGGFCGYGVRLYRARRTPQTLIGPLRAGRRSLRRVCGGLQPQMADGRVVGQM